LPLPPANPFFPFSPSPPPHSNHHNHFLCRPKRALVVAVPASSLTPSTGHHHPRMRVAREHAWPPTSSIPGHRSPSTPPPCYSARREERRR
ncbi:Os10g0112800, partial [Oryza sativa Japonica Group]